MSKPITRSKPALLGRLGHRNNAARRPREDRILAGEELGRRQAARRHHEHDLHAAALGVERFGDARDIAGEDRREIGVDHRRVAASDELDQRRAFMADRDLGKAQRPRHRRDLALVLGIAIGVHEDDGQRAEAARLGCRQIAADRRKIGRPFDRSVAEHPLVDLDHVGIELLWLDDVERENFGARLIADFERVAKAARRHQQGPLALALEKRVGRHRRAHFHHANGARRDRLIRRKAKKIANGLHGRVAIGWIIGEELARMRGASRVAADDVGESAAPVDPEIPLGLRARALRREIYAALWSRYCFPYDRGEVWRNSRQTW